MNSARVNTYFFMTIVLTICLFCSALIGALLIVSTDAGNYNRYQKQLNVYDYVGVSEEDLRWSQALMASYLQGEDEAMVTLSKTDVSMLCVMQPIFNEKEVHHMKDVRALFDLARRVLITLLLMSLVTIGMMCIARYTDEHAKREIGWTAYNHADRNGLIVGLVLLIAVAAFLIYQLQTDFYGTFYVFHELLFDNDLWLLNPDTDAMIRMYPQQFFEWIARDIGLMAAKLLLILAAVPVGLGMYRHIRKRRAFHA
ncbi:TIGR01906 family membrane protein [Eubacteriales bacterium OttesenSCG-928-N13]|nr:TIGR01906 family membrane protein [Eubacteriales bacterium OttesenSCG-928-N13]